MSDGVGVTEQGEVVTNLPIFAATNPSYVWVTVDPAHLLAIMLDRLEEVPAFNYQIVSSTDDAPAGVHMSTSRLTRFGFRCSCEWRPPMVRGAASCTCGFPPNRRSAMHMVWSPGDMTRNPNALMEGFTHADLLRFGTDVRDWCKEHNLPLPTSLSGIAAALLRDGRFWPEARGRVPTATNERIRPWLPGVYSELRAEPARRHDAVAIDQRAAYHRAAQEVPMPDATTLFARGFFNAPETSPLWAQPGDGVYERTMSQPGVVYVTYSARPLRAHEARPPAIKPGEGRCALWTAEVPYVETQGVTIHGIVAAWTSSDHDHGIARYGAWAEERIGEASEYRKRWLKPTLHALYGLTAMRTRKVSIGHYRGRGERDAFLLGPHEFPVHRHDLPSLPSATTNVATLGVLQAEIRARSFKLANALSVEGVTILHIHADGIHAAGDIPLIPNGWTIKPKTNLMYVDRVSWLSDEGDSLPGRDERQRIDLRRHHARQPFTHTHGIYPGHPAAPR